MEAARHEVPERFRGKIEILAEAIVSAQKGHEQAVDSIRRIAHAIVSDGDGDPRFRRVREIASEVEESEANTIAMRAAGLVSELRTLHAEKLDEAGDILVIDDDPVVSRLIESVVGAPGRAVVLCDSAAAALDQVRARDFALIVLDLILPDSDGRNLLLELRDHPGTARVPIVVTSAKGVEAKAECYTLGADGYFEKPFNPTAFAAAVSTILTRSEEARREAREDGLTKLPNRAAFREAYLRMASMAERTGTPLSAALLDLDLFKEINDSHGHEAGDDALRHAVAVIAQALRKSDYLARWGGEEFAVLLPETGVEGARDALEKAAQALRGLPFQTRNESTISITFSAGIVDVGKDETVEEVIERADSRLYLAKAAGRNRIVVRSEEVVTQRPRILLAEDDPLVASIIQHRLARERWHVDHFDDGIDAMTALEGESRYSLFLLDIQLPGADGYEILRRIRSGQKTRRTPVVVLTAMGKENDISRGFELGANDYIVKPVSPIELVSRLRRLLSRGLGLAA